jgi:hypothetical protein
VLNLYWELVTDNDDLKARQANLEMAQKPIATKGEIELRNRQGRNLAGLRVNRPAANKKWRFRWPWFGNRKTC